MLFRGGGHPCRATTRGRPYGFFVSYVVSCGRRPSVQGDHTGSQLRFFRFLCCIVWAEAIRAGRPRGVAPTVLSFLMLYRVGGGHPCRATTRGRNYGIIVSYVVSCGRRPSVQGDHAGSPLRDYRFLCCIVRAEAIRAGRPRGVAPTGLSFLMLYRAGRGHPCRATTRGPSTVLYCFLSCFVRAAWERPYNIASIFTGLHKPPAPPNRIIFPGGRTTALWHPRHRHHHSSPLTTTARPVGCIAQPT